LFQRIFCRFIGHRRSRQSVHQIEGRWHSRCKRCGARLVRLSQADWRELSDAT
jgi:hypothetical protein